MKKLFIALVALMSLTVTNVNAQSYTINGNNITAVKTTKAKKATATETKYKYTHNGVDCVVYLSSNGRAYCTVTSRNGKEYKKYLGEEISRKICAEYGVTYKDKK